MKNKTSSDFKAEPNSINKTIHVLENLHFAAPFKDWDDGDFSVGEFKKRLEHLRVELIATFVINFCVSLLMLVPLWFCGQ